MISTVTKRSGAVAPFDADKLNLWGEWAAQHDVAWSDVVIKTLKKLYEGISTVKLHEALIKTCADYKTEKHLRMAARLLRGDIYKTVYGSAEPQPFSERYKKLVSEGYWKGYGLTEDQLSQLDNLIDHDYNDKYEYSALKQFQDKYGLGYFSGEGKNKQKWLVESPQERLMIIAVSKFHNDWNNLPAYYDRLKKRQININTPTMMSSGTPEAGNASCCVISAGDSSGSISASTEVAYGMTGSRAGIGFEYAIRSAGDVVGNNKCLHTGKIQHYRMLTESVKAVVQGKGRVGAITMTYNALDPELEDLLRLKRPATHQDKRITTMDYSLATNNEFMRRVAKNEDWLLISMRDAPDLYDAFYDERNKFPELLELYLQSGKGQVVKARDMAIEHLKTRQETGKQYDFFLDNGNDHTPFSETIRLSNLCVRGDTRILTKRGEIEIESLVGKKIEVWNSEEWSEVEVVKTGEDQDIIQVYVDTFEDGQFIETKVVYCTPYHRWYNDRGEELRTFQLCEGLWTMPWESPTGKWVTHRIAGLETSSKADTYCFKEPKLGLGVFEGVLTGQCQEIQLPTKPVTSSKELYEELDDDGVVALCFLMALDVGKIETDEDYEEAAYLAAASLDTDIDAMDYPYPLIAHTAKNYRSIGVGMTNVAYHMAKKGLFYDSPEGLAELHRLAERHYYYMLKASIRLAKERGKFGYFDRTKWSKGWLPIDSYKQEIDSHVDNTLHYDWSSLRQEVLEYGVRFSVLTAHMPCESSSVNVQ